MKPNSRVEWVEELISEALKNDQAELECQKDAILHTLARRHTKKARVDDESSIVSKSKSVSDIDGSGGRVSPSGRFPGASFSRKKEGVFKNNSVIDVVGRECLDAEHHHSFLLKEMMWMAEDFSKERKRHASLAKKQSKSIEAYVKGQSARVAKSLKGSALALHRIAQRSAREIRAFWGKLERFVAYKQKRLCDEVRQKAMDRHLVYLVKQTERYTKSLYSHHRSSGDSPIPIDENQNSNGTIALSSQDGDGTDSILGIEDVTSNNSNSTGGGFVGDLDGDVMSEGTSSSKESFEFEEESDNEATIAAEEQLLGGQNPAEEISALKLEADLSVEELMKQYGYVVEESALKNEGVTEAESGTRLAKKRRRNYFSDYYSTAMEESDSDKEFIAVEEVDDEETIAAEEHLAKPGSYSQELSALQSDANTPIDDILRSYGYSKKSINPTVDTESNSSASVTTGQEPIPSVENCSPMEIVKKIDGDKCSSSSSYRSIFSEAEGDDESSDSDFVGVHVEDDERTLAEAERLEGQYDTSEEIKRLKMDSEIPLEDVLKTYKYENNNANDDRCSDALKNGKEGKPRRRRITSGSAGKESTNSGGDGDTSAASGDELNADDALERLGAMDEKARSFTIMRPFLLSKSVKLREYQHSGLNWLVSLHERRLNGILADEMGLGKTLQTITLLAYLACHKGIWGPHLIIVPTSCMVNWEIEFKRFCPGFKVLTYYGNAKIRRDLRAGWTKPSAFHVCITSYQLAVADATSFKRKKWYFLILDEAHNIKNFKSQRWQTLLAFSSQRRLLLTGTPLQNSLMELWSLMHFLMPYIFRSRKEFGYWFSQPLDNMVEGTRAINANLVNRLHAVLRPFVLRRLKKEVEKQLPQKHEHIVMCRLNRRQAQLYEEFMSRSSTRVALESGRNFVGMMNVLMQLRKVCNHPDLFEARPIVTSLGQPRLILDMPALVVSAGAMYGAMKFTSGLGTFLWWDAHYSSIDGNCWGLCPASFQAVVPPSETQYCNRAIIIKDEELKREEKELHLSKKLISALKAQRTKLLANAHERMKCLERVNRRRCSSPLLSCHPTNWRLVQICTRLGGASACHPTRLTAEYRRSKGWEECEVQGLTQLRQFWVYWSSEMISVAKMFCFCVPSVTAPCPALSVHVIPLYVPDLGPIVDQFSDSSTQTIHVAYIQQRISFPDRSLVRYDGGKLQTLNVLLSQLKQGGHKVLIFTQMSKMLDILEVFLNAAGHTYVRLDGSTGVERRQCLMDRFNTDSKIFCFILSTRSGGLGINLTAADSVVFYDSDWNPAMDAQAQDRAHRIGQTREVHIYRLVTTGTVEENILRKAQQKRHLDQLVMEEGDFTANPRGGEGGKRKGGSLFNTSGLCDILGVPQLNFSDPKSSQPLEGGDYQGASGGKLSQDVKAVMDQLEDAEDVAATRAIQKEVAEEAQEFNEEAQEASNEVTVAEEAQEFNEEAQEASNEVTGQPNSTADRQELASSSPSTVEVEKSNDQLEKEFSAWQGAIGPDVATLEASLLPVERYALDFKENVDPYNSIWYRTEEQRRLEMMESAGNMDTEELEAEREAEELRCMETGDLLVTNIQSSDIPNHSSLYASKRAHAIAEARRRDLEGKAWVRKKDQYGVYFWLNEDTGVSTFDMPKTVVQREMYNKARVLRFRAPPFQALLLVMSFLRPASDRLAAALVCQSWRKAARDPCFHIRVIQANSVGTSQFRLGGQYDSLAAALAVAEPGTTVEVCTGRHHCDGDIVIESPIRIIGSSLMASAGVVLELGGSLHWSAKGGFMLGIHIRRPRHCATPRPLVVIQGGGRVILANCVIDSSRASGIAVIEESRPALVDCIIRGCAASGVEVADSCTVSLSHVNAIGNNGHGLFVSSGGLANVEDSVFKDNGGAGVKLELGAQALVVHTDFSGNHNGPYCGKGHIMCHKNKCRKNSTTSLPIGFSSSNDPAEAQGFIIKLRRRVVHFQRPASGRFSFTQ